MNTAKDYGKSAQKSRINAPTLDENLLRWLTISGFEKHTEHYIEWWEGWYEALNESFAVNDVNFTPARFVPGYR